MQAYMQLKIKPMEMRRLQVEPKKAGVWFPALNRFFKKSVSYYLDEDLRRMGAPYRWTQ